MRRSILNTAPTITLLTRSPSSSRKTQTIFNALFGMMPIDATQKGIEGFGNDEEDDIRTINGRIQGGNATKRDSMNAMFHPLLGMNWDSVASVCPSSGTILHFLSLTSTSAREYVETESVSNDDDFGLSLLSVTEGFDDLKSELTTMSTREAMYESVLMSRQMLASHMEQHRNPKTLGLTLAALHALGKPITHSRVMGRANNGIPLLSWRRGGLWTSNKDTIEVNWENTSDQSPPNRLREVVLPYFDDATGTSGRSLLAEFSSSPLSRPITGLYQWPSLTSNKKGVAFRPLPCGTEDLNLPPPTLVFQCQSIDKAKTSIEKIGGSAAKVGFSGKQQQGQLRVTGLSMLSGLDVRFCESESFSTSFAEAEEAVMAGSLEELQSVNVMADGRGQENVRSSDDNDDNNNVRRTDPMTDLGDCFVEFRANIKNPSGFFKSTSRSGSGGRIAKSYSMPFE